MPRDNAKSIALKRLRKIIDTRARDAYDRAMESESDGTADELDEMYVQEYDAISSRRYYVRKSTYKKRANKWEVLLDGAEDERLDDTEFLAHFRMPRATFYRLVDLVNDDPAFRSAGSKPLRGGAIVHLLVLLKFLGTFGNGNTMPTIGQFLGLAAGTVRAYLCRAVTAILRLEAATITWPDEEERSVIAQQIQPRYGFVNWVGLADGTLFPLATQPLDKAEDYYSKKASYSVNALVVCDDVAQIRKLVDPDQYFDHNEYLLGDSAFQVSCVMMSAFKKPPRAELHQDKTYFNYMPAKLRIKTEHCIGLLKTRFQYLKGIRVQLSSKRKHMRRLIRYVTAACVLHNLLISDPVPEEWQDELNGVSEDDEPEVDELNEPVPAGAESDERRNQLLGYLLEMRR